MGIGIFVTATDTDAGKSFITAGLVRALRDAGCDAFALKPVACGRDAEGLNADVRLLLDAQGMTAAQAGAVNLYDFEAFRAPCFAGTTTDAVDMRRLTDWCADRIQRHDVTLIEGVGGLMTPLATQATVADWLRAMPNVRVLLVALARLGGINHALLTLEALHHMHRAPSWVLLNPDVDADNDMLRQHARAIAPMLSENAALHMLSRAPGRDKVAAPEIRDVLERLMRMATCADEPF